MKTYSARDVEDDINHVGWVPADVAQVMYEYLSVIAYQGMHSGECQRMAQDALAAADGEEV